MSHFNQQKFVEKLKNDMPEFFKEKKVLEVGSLNINGSIRPLFEKCDYLGVDVGKGEGVDLVCQGQELDHPDETYDVTASTECFEHNPYWAETFANMVRMTKKEGLVFFTCATDGRPIHGTYECCPLVSPLTVELGCGDFIEYHNYYMNLNEKHFREKFNFEELFLLYKFLVRNDSYDLYFWGIKK